MKDIADRAGVSIASVSLTLSNHARISAKTRAHILNVCRQMNYQVNPVGRALSSARKLSSGKSYLGTLALLECEQRFEISKNNAEVDKQICLLKKICQQYGYKLDHFVVTDSCKEQQALSRIIRSRGIRGVIVYGFNSDIHQWALEWDCFAAIAIANSMTEHFIHSISHCAHGNLSEAISRITQRGYCAPGFIVGQSFQQHYLTEYVYSTASLKLKKIPPIQLDFSLKKSVWRKQALNWLNRHSPDVLISNGNREIFDMLREENIRVPEDIGFFSLDVWSLRHLSGFFKDHTILFEILIDILHGMMLRNKIGPPKNPYCISLSAEWNEGRTIRPESS
ncbi:MAG: LacI family DNA-binding transcriptional regulator [Kiritimatiellales bacterium]